MDKLDKQYTLYAIMGAITFIVFVFLMVWPFKSYDFSADIKVCRLQCRPFCMAEFKYEKDYKDTGLPTCKCDSTEHCKLSPKEQIAKRMKKYSDDKEKENEATEVKEDIDD